MTIPHDLPSLEFMIRDLVRLLLVTELVRLLMWLVRFAMVPLSFTYLNVP